MMLSGNPGDHRLVFILDAHRWMDQILRYTSKGFGVQSSRRATRMFDQEFWVRMHAARELMFLKSTPRHKRNLLIRSPSLVGVYR
jgi:hypothetical protein